MSLNQGDIAALAGLTTRRIRHLESEGSAPDRLPDGSYSCEAVGKWLRDRILSELGVANDGKAYDYEAERARLTKAQADRTELEVRELRAELVRMPVVEQHWQSMVASARARLLALPSRIAAQIAGPDRLQQVQDKAQALVYEALAELAGDAVPEQIRNRAAAESERANDENLSAAAETDHESVGRRKSGAKRGG